MALKVYACLDEIGVKWTSTDMVRIGEVRGPSAPIILLIGVKPKSLASEDADTAAFRCRHSQSSTSPYVDVKIWESSITRSTGPKLFPPVLSSNPNVDVRHRLTHPLDLPLSA